MNNIDCALNSISKVCIYNKKYEVWDLILAN